MLLLGLETLFEIKGKTVTEENLYSVPVFTIFCPHNQECLFKEEKKGKKKKKIK